MNRSTGIPVLFFLIFLFGILEIAITVNKSLNKRASIDWALSPEAGNSEEAILFITSEKLQ